MPEGRKGRVKDATASVAALLVFFFSSPPPFFLFFFILPTSSVARLGSIPRRFHFEDNSVLDRAILLCFQFSQVKTGFLLFLDSSRPIHTLEQQVPFDSFQRYPRCK